jgi:hypothetical protein
MTTFEIKHNEQLHDKRQKRRLTRVHFRHVALAFVALGLLASCSGLNFSKNSFQPGLLEIGENMAQYNCRKNNNLNTSQDCVNQVHENYDATYKKSNLQRR